MTRLPAAATPGLTEPTQRGYSSRIIGEVVVDLGFATRAEVDEAVAEARRTRRQTGRVLVERGVITEDQLSRVIADRHGLDHVDLVEFDLDMQAVRLIPAARYYIDYSDFSVWILDVDRVRWVGGYGRMDSADGDSYAAAAPDPVAAVAPRAIAHLNADHADALLTMARALGGYPDATAATCTAADRFGLDLSVSTPRGRATTRVGYPEPLRAASELREATVNLARRARL